MSDINSKIEAAKEKISSLKSQIEQVQKSKTDLSMGAALQQAIEAAETAAPTAAPPSSAQLEHEGGGGGGEGGGPEGGGGGAANNGGGVEKVKPAALRGPASIKVRRTLKGHFGKITAIHWDGTSTQVVSAGQDGNLLIWNAVTANKTQAIPLKSSYVMSVGIEQSRGNLVACGGLDNLCTVYQVANPDFSNAMEMASHDGFLSCCRFTSEQEIITSSGDSTCIQWDIPHAKPVSTFAEHTADAMYLSLKPKDKHVFASCSVDQTVKIWDTRATNQKSQQTFQGHHSGDINAVEFMPSDGNVFATCSQDSTVRLFDLRAYNQVNDFRITPVTAASLAAAAAAAGENAEGAGMDGAAGEGGGVPGAASPAAAPMQPIAGGGGDNAENGGDGIEGEGGAGGEGGGNAAARAAAMEFEEEVGYDAFTSLAFSGSGRLIFCGHADGSVYAFDVLSDSEDPVFTLQGAHERNVSSIGVSPSGNALATASWDSALKIWA